MSAANVSALSPSALASVEPFLKCPLSQDTMRDPVTVTKSGQTYDREWLCQSLLHHPNMDPATGQRYEEQLAYCPNIATRYLLTVAKGEAAYVPFDDTGFDQKYQEVWQRHVRALAAITDPPVYEDDDDDFDDSTPSAVVPVNPPSIVSDMEKCKVVLSLLFGMNRNTISIGAAWRYVNESPSQEEAIMVAFKALIMDPRCSVLQLYTGGQSNSNNIPRGIEQANEAWTKADRLGLHDQANNGNEWAQALIAGRLHDGMGMDRNFARAMECAQIAAGQGNAMALFQMGRCHYDGFHNVPRDLDKAFDCFSKAAQQGHAGAETELGRMFYEGQGVPQRDERALYYYYRAAQRGYSVGQFGLGWMLENGHGEQRNRREALELYQRAGNQGHVLAIMASRRLSEQINQFQL